MLEMKLCIPASLDMMPTVRNTVASFLLPCNPTVDDITEIKTLLTEALSNSIIHGYHEDASQEVIIEVKQELNSISLCVIDQGKGIEDIALARKPMFSTKKDDEHAGMGFTIMEALCDELNIVSSSKGTKVTMKRVFNNEYS